MKKREKDPEKEKIFKELCKMADKGLFNNKSKISTSEYQKVNTTPKKQSAIVKDFHSVSNPESDLKYIPPGYFSKNEKKYCSKCQSLMSVRAVKSGEMKGTRFWVCSNYPTCKSYEKIAGKN